MSNISEQGIILRKIPIKESHLLISFLNTSGEKKSVLMLGGQGSKKKIKGTNFLELGQLIEYRCTKSKYSHGNSDLPQCRDWSLVWQHKHLRYDYVKFELFYYWISLIESIIPQSETVSNNDEVPSSIYLHVINALSYLDLITLDLNNRNIVLARMQLFFLMRFAFLSGIAPLTKDCLACGLNFSIKESGDVYPALFLLHEGGFYCKACSTDQRRKDDWIWFYWEWARTHNWKNMENLDDAALWTHMGHGLEVVKNYITHHLNLSLQRLQIQDVSGFKNLP